GVHALEADLRDSVEQQRPLLALGAPVVEGSHGGGDHFRDTSVSMISQMAWMRVMWHSCMRVVSSEGTTSARSTNCADGPPSPQRRAIVTAPRSRPARMARKTLGERPLVLMPTSTSPGWASASTCRLKTSSYEKSLATQVSTTVSVVRATTGRGA